MPTRAKQAIAVRLILYILLFSSVVTLLTTGLQLYLDYTRDVDLITDRFEQIRQSHLSSISASLWAADLQQLRLQLEGIRTLPDMRFLAIEVDGKPYLTVGRPGGTKGIRVEYPLYYMYGSAPVLLGTLTATASLEGVYHRLLDRTLVILGSQAIKTFLVSSFMFLVFQYLVTRHLSRLSAWVRKQDLATPAEPLSLERTPSKHGPDELDDVVAALNDMSHKLREYCVQCEREQERRAQAEQLACLGEMAAGIAHEIRNPLYSIINAVVLLDRSDLSQAERSEVIGIVNSESSRLRRILDGFLQFGRVTAPRPVDTDLGALLDEVGALAISMSEGSGPIRLSTRFHSERCRVLCDPDHMRQILWNLLLNSVQAMPNGGEIVVATRPEVGRVRVSVSDNGPGIPVALRERVARPFVTGRRGGTGLGLSIVKRILVQHGSDLMIASEEDRGTEISFTLEVA